MSTTSSLSSNKDVVPVTAAEANDDYSYYVPAHSDYLVHWTGKDIDKREDPDWHTDHSSTTDSNITRLYIDRLKAILRHGLWMMDDDETVAMDGYHYQRPKHYRTCFTELKLSLVRGHARRYGRLGIGFKRFFLFNRLGCPMTYYHSNRVNWFAPTLWASQPSEYDEFWACFLKPMTEVTGDRTMRYSFYNESEWRIIYSDDIARRLADCGRSDVLNAFVPSAAFSAELTNLISSSPHPPGAVIPVRDQWFAMIVYPSLAVKVAAEADSEVRSLMNSIKPTATLPSSFDKKNPAWLEVNCKPIELDLDACRNF